MKLLRKRFLTGLAALLPLALTLYLLIWLIGGAESLLGGLMQHFLPNDFYRPGLGVLVGILLVFLVGFFTEVLIIKRIAAYLEKVIYRIPLIKSIYGATRDFLGFLVQGESKGPRQVVLVTLTEGVRHVGILTRKNLDFLQTPEVNSEQVAVYIPMSYQMGGFTVIVPLTSVVPLSLPLDQAMRFVMSAGIIEDRKSGATTGHSAR
ncbi:MAG: DUF502 domain-containing protein [Proteobacteria bacterium]|nr:DUF502 domain-containing protein [Pseudomonadota bacterium]MBU1687736.1 DUF502 domain-containing protein [Pseudomonadota bacterium]